MNVMRNRVKEHFPTVLLTLLSIVQALALELLWTHVHETDAIYEMSWIAVLSWIQIAATLLGVVLIWVIYVSDVMRFKWVPTLGDSVVPFFIGLLEFMLIELLGVDELGVWLMVLALTFAVMNWMTHTTMRRARLDGDNDAFFESVSPATLNDLYGPLSVVVGLAATGLYFEISGDSGWLALAVLILASSLLGWQLHTVANFWKQSTAQDE